MSSMAGGNHRTDNIFREKVKVDNYMKIINVSACTGMLNWDKHQGLISERCALNTYSTLIQ